MLLPLASVVVRDYDAADLCELLTRSTTALKATIVSPFIDLDVRVDGHSAAVLHLPYHSKYTKRDEEAEYGKLDIRGTSLWESPTAEGRSITMEDISLFMSMLKNVYRGLLEDEEFLGRLRNFHFDVALHEVYEPYSAAIFEIIGVTKTVAVSAFGMTPYAYEIIGIRQNPSFVPGVYSTYSDDMTFWERLNNFKFEIELDFRYRSWERETWSHFNDIYPGFPDFRELLKRKVGVLLLNINEFTETPRPTANIVRYIGGLAVHPPKPLGKSLDAVLDERSTNVLLSFGTISRAKDMPLWLKKGDKRLSAFITHAGMNSILEATFFGKPLVVVPLFGDQYLNAKNVERRGMAVMIDKSELNKDTLTAAIREVLSTNS
ncbi:UDP-glucoronosyl and UDP-glucosyl transferase [Teladorsagia circumcincta]|uniref:glucuronosyltransferase n=1 Tax=Teladorsagia circumcincta TaxID=45464 RepID=A0A2G9URP1_TELCI|nr:UDP-glucoronosyl and UDP-glucosyl transferase [Teladorsagia circumcincta]